MLRLWGRDNSVNVQKPILCMEELGVAYQRIDAGLAFGIVGTPDYRAMNPNGAIPTLDDDGFVLWESNVIVRYLAERYGRGTKFFPEDLRVRAVADQWMDWQQTTLSPHVTTCFWGLVRSPGAKTQAEIDDALRKGGDAMALLDARLARVPYISGEAFGAADCVLAPTVHRWLHMPIERPPTPHASRYLDAIMQRPSCIKVMRLPLT